MLRQWKVLNTTRPKWIRGRYLSCFAMNRVICLRNSLFHVTPLIDKLPEHPVTERATSKFPGCLHEAQMWERQVSRRGDRGTSTSCLPSMKTSPDQPLWSATCASAPSRLLSPYTPTPSGNALISHWGLLSAHLLNSCWACPFFLLPPLLPTSRLAL